MMQIVYFDYSIFKNLKPCPAPIFKFHPLFGVIYMIPKVFYNLLKKALESG